ncbi:hypothetical protein GEMRC1_003197 [Eukaryota sp. GEM-RC1]
MGAVDQLPLIAFIESDDVILDNALLLPLIDSISSSIEFHSQRAILSCYSYFFFKQQNLDPIASIFVGKDQSSTLLVLLIDQFSSPNPSFYANVMSDISKNDSYTSFSVQLLDQNVLFQDFMTATYSDLQRISLFALPLSCIILLLTFQSLWLVSIPLVVTLLSLTLTTTFSYIMSLFIEFPSFVLLFQLVLLFSLSFNYTMIILTRMKHELKLHTSLPMEQLVSNCFSRSADVISISSLTLFVALLGLLLFGGEQITPLAVGSIFSLYAVLLFVSCLFPCCFCLYPLVFCNPIKVKQKHLNSLNF